MFPLALILVAFLPRLVITSPHGPITLRSQPLPLGVNHIAHDERTGNYLAYRDGVYGTLGRAKIHHPSELSKRTTVNCGRLNVGDLKNLTGWEKIEEYARKRSGLAKLRASTSLGNEKLGATLCTNLYIKHQGTPECHGKVEQHGTVAGTNSTRLRVQSGYTIEWKTERAYWGRRAGAKNPVTIHIPKFLDYESVATTMIFSDSYSPQTVFNTSRPQEIWAVAKKGETCYPRTRTERCKVARNGHFRSIATGVVWFTHIEPTNSFTKSQGWPVNIERLLSIDERVVRSSEEFSGSLVGNRQIYDGAGCEFKKSRP